VPNVVYTCGHCLIDGYDFSSQFTDLTVNRSSENLDVSTMGTGTRKHKGGVRDASIAGKGYVDLESSGLDPVIFGKDGADATLVTAFVNGIPNVACSTGGGYSVSGVSVKYVMGGSYGALLPFELDAKSQSDLVQVAVLHNCLTTGYGSCALSTDGITEVTVPMSTDGIGASEKLYAGFHITTLSTGIVGNGISAVIAAASSSGFGTSSNRITFTAKTCKSGTWATPIAKSALSTDQPFWRAMVTVATGTSTGYTGTGLIWASIQ
jgi:hypothetical protein